MICLIIVPSHLYKFQYPNFLSGTDFPIGLAYLAAALKAAGHTVCACNPNNDPRFPTARDMVEHHVARALDEFKPDVILTGGLCVDYAFFRDCLTVIHTVKPDATKLWRSTEDALTGIAWRDDAQISVQVVEKRYGSQSGALIQISSLTEVGGGFWK